MWNSAKFYISSEHCLAIFFIDFTILVFVCGLCNRYSVTPLFRGCNSNPISPCCEGKNWDISLVKVYLLHSLILTFMRWVSSLVEFKTIIRVKANLDTFRKAKVLVFILKKMAKKYPCGQVDKAVLSFFILQPNLLQSEPLR